MLKFRRDMMVFLSVFAIFFFARGSGLACDYCMLSQGLSPLQIISGHGFRVDQRYTVLDNKYDGTRKVDDPGNKETHLTTQFTGFYSVNPDFTAMLIVPYVRRSMQEWHTHHDGDREFHEGDASGLGDITLMGRYTFFRRHELDSTTMVAGQGGVKLPSGATNSRDSKGRYMDAHPQPGSGSTDVLLGLNMSHAVNRFTLASNVLYSKANEGSVGNSSHEFGDSLNYDFSGLYRLFPETLPGRTFSLAFGVAGELRGKEQTNGVDLDNTGGHVLFLNTGALFIPSPNWIVEFNYRPAMYHDLNSSPQAGNQLGESYKMTFSVTSLFSGL